MFYDVNVLVESVLLLHIKNESALNKPRFRWYSKNRPNVLPLSLLLLNKLLTTPGNLVLLISRKLNADRMA